ncbi:MAG TPA: PEP-CTERM sorting domain-containing protein [Phycisphaerae bacterium]|nr:PEP-CTERM sorting domain-containing protein [Phycisphaerae bacterium]HNU45859.1 PEP-CTERM sorting domain-containing protein [Phycisphaerae bacterium]
MCGCNGSTPGRARDFSAAGAAWIVGAVVLVAAGWAAPARADVQWFLNDYDGFLAAAGAVQEIDFETLPDGTPSVPRTPITPEFNYTNQGVTFSSPNPTLEIGALFEGNFPLEAYDPSYEDAWIVGDLVIPASAVGVSFPGTTVLYVYDAGGALMDAQYFSASGNFFFLGCVSDVPIGSAAATSLSEGEIVWSFWFTPVPEPTGLVLLITGAVCFIARRAR